MAAEKKRQATKLDHYKGLALWPHQVAAIRMCQQYFKASTSRAALVQLPTGAGKTGIMAVLSSVSSKQRPVLVICPSAALVRQLERDFSGAFWKKIGADVNDWAPDFVLQLLPSKINEIIKTMDANKEKRIVVVGTVQALNDIRNGAGYQRLVTRFSAVLFDEGHREPAPEWAAAVRGLRCHTVLFSATPFRNDLKLFDVDRKHVSFMSFREAVRQRLIRSVQIEDQALADVKAFVRAAIKTRDRLVRSGRALKSDKMIVRAGRAEHVDELFRAFVRELGKRSGGVVAVHDTFTLQGPEGKQKRPDVPDNLGGRPERFWIHQYMLVEGIDDPSFTMLALFDPFASDRELVQQIGRLTRLPKERRKEAPAAYVLARTGDNAERSWRRFLEFDRACEEASGPPVRSDMSVLDALVGALPRVDYIAGKFRGRVNPKSEFFDDLQIPQSALVFDVDQNFNLSRFEREVTQALVNDDRQEVSAGKITASCKCHVSLKLRQTPFLREGLFQVPTLEVTVYALHGRRLFLYDSAGLAIDELSAVKGRIDPRLLRVLMPNAKDTTFSVASMTNSDLGPLAIRSRRVTGLSLDRADAFLGEKMYVLSSVTGNTGEQRRTIGFSRRRLREGAGYTSTPSEFAKWTNEIATELSAGRPEAAFFDKYATPVGVPDDTTPLNILVDLYGVDRELLDDSGNLIKPDLENVCSDVEADPTGVDGFQHRFSLKLRADDAALVVWIKWDRNRRKYWLRSDGLSAYKLKSNARVSLTHRLNTRQAFRIIPATPKLVYTSGQFYNIDLDFSSATGAGRMITELMSGLTALRATTSEKGPLTGTATEWPITSVFGVIDKYLKSRLRQLPFGQPFDGLVCDDFGDEAADFIGYDKGGDGSDPRAVFIAAKWKAGNPGVGASGLYDVCGQITKNLPYLKVDANTLPGSPEKWTTPWTPRKASGIRIPRLRTRTGSAEFKKSFNAARRKPASRRQAWMVLGGGILSIGALKLAFAQKPAPPPEALQLYFLVLATYSACQAVGVDLKIFCAD